MALYFRNGDLKNFNFQKKKEVFDYMEKHSDYFII